MMIDAPVANLSADGDSAKVRWETWIFHGAAGQARVEDGVFENEYHGPTTGVRGARRNDSSSCLSARSLPS